MMTSQTDWEILLKLAVAALLSGVLGWERQSFGKKPGLRTHILVGVSAAFFVGLTGAVVEHFGQETGVMQYDPIRVIEAVVAGISFLGAGTIFVSRGKGETVQGLTTAAAIWATAGVGLAVGVGRYTVAVGATILVFLVLHVLGLWEKRGLPGMPKAKHEGEETS